MTFLNVLEAARHRLEGNDPKKAPDLVQLMQSWTGQNTNALLGVERNAIVNTWLERRTAIVPENAQVSVPLYWRDLDGQRATSVYPSVTYSVIANAARFDATSVQGSTIVHEASSYREVVDEETGETELLPRAGFKARYAPPWDYTLEIRVYSKDAVLSAFLQTHILQKVFPPRTFLRVPLADGCSAAWDMWLTNTQDLDKREAVLRGTPGVEREYCTAFTYLVEGYLDNTSTAELVAYVDTLDICAARS